MRGMLSWTPRELPDGIYCSSACGASCKKIDYDRAKLAAKSLALQMGAGWKPNVWENMGWFYNVTKGIARVHVHRSPQNDSVDYTVYLNGTKQFIANDPDPLVALSKALDIGRFTVNKIERELNFVQGRKVKA